ncbi:MAG: c-type cytochrome [Gammaproteobacteria bacterium]|nr:c-type cytochrome [Gammaproteobacteria bacterium]
MSSRRYQSLLPLLVLATSVTGCQHMGTSKDNSFFTGRYTDFILGNMPEQYVDLENPLPASIENISAGKKLYQQECLQCHGWSGKGDGPAGKQMHPTPANLAFTRKLPITTDAFFFWTVSEGGKTLATAMPTFKERLSDKKIWQIIHYINDSVDFNEEHHDQDISNKNIPPTMKGYLDLHWQMKFNYQDISRSESCPTNSINTQSPLE